MAYVLQFGAGAWMFGRFVDHCATDTCGAAVGMLEIIERAGLVGGPVVLDRNCPFNDPDGAPGQMRAAPALANVSRRFPEGSFTHPVAIDVVNRAASATPALGAARVRQDALPAQRIAQAPLPGRE